jgi:hypothetical protein
MPLEAPVIATTVLAKSISLLSQFAPGQKRKDR